MSNRRFSEDHEWVALEGDIGTVGISAYAQEQLGDVVFVELPEVGKEVNQKDELAVVESVKAASEIYAPIAGEVTAVNEVLEGAPQTVNEDAEGAGWLVRLRVTDPGELDSLMDAAAYQAYVDGLD